MRKKLFAALSVSVLFAATVTAQPDFGAGVKGGLTMAPSPPQVKERMLL
jgi:hypothetical protein